MADRIDTRHAEIEKLRGQLEFWRERLQIASNSCRSGALRERAAHEVQSLERMLDVLGREPGSK